MNFLKLLPIVLVTFFSNANAENFVMGALGDSISTGFNSYHILSERDGSWSTGNMNSDDFESHKMKIEKWLEISVDAYNMAIPGVTSKNLKSQVRRLLKKTAKPDYVTVLIGANDACKWKDNYQGELENYKNNVNSAVHRLTQANPNIKILLVPVPNMLKLWELGKDKKYCLKVWRLLNLCEPIFSRRSTDDQRKQFSDRIQKINSKLQDIANTYPSNAFYYDFIAEIDFDEESVSEVDCFHPSAYGQKMISDITFNRDLFPLKQ